MKKLLKIVAWAATILLGLILLIAVFTQTPLFRTWLKNFAVSEANNILQPELSIDEIDGTLFNNLHIRNLLLSENNDTLLVISDLHLSYNLLTLFNNHIEVDYLSIERPKIHLSEDSLGIWSFSKLVSNNTISDKTGSENDSPFGFTVSVDLFSLLDGSAHIESPRSLVPERVSQLNISLNGRYSSKEIEINLDSLSFQTAHPNLTMNKIGFNFIQNEEELGLSNLFIKTGLNQFESEARHYQHKNNYLNLTAKNLDLREFEFILPDIKLNTYPDINYTSKYDQDSLKVEIRIQSGDESLLLIGTGENYLALLDSSIDKNIYFTFDLQMKNMNLQNWVDQYPETNINGQILVNGSLTGMANLYAEINGEVTDFKYENYLIDFIQINTFYKENNLTGDMHLLSKYADLDLQLNMNNLFEKPHYESIISVSHLDIGEIVLSDSIRSDLNFKLYLQGVNFSPSDNITSIRLEGQKSQIKDIEIDTVSTVFQLSGTDYNLERCQINTRAGIITFNGSGDLTSNQCINYKINIGDLGTIAEFINADSLQANGVISGVITGKPDSLSNNMHLDLTQVKYNEFRVDSLTGKAVTQLLDSSNTMTIDLFSNKIKMGAINIDEVKLESNYDNEQFTSEIDIGFNSDLRLSLSAILRPDSLLFLSIPHIDLGIIGEQWTGKLEKMMYDPRHRELEITALNLKCITSEDPGHIFAEGLLSFVDKENFKLRIEGIHPKTLLSYLGIDFKIDGRVNFNLDLSGTADKPVLKGDLIIGGGYLSSLKYESINSQFAYENDRFNYNFALNFNGKDSLITTGNLPLHLSLTDTLKLFNSDRPIDFQIKSEGIPIGSFFSNVKLLPDISGTLFCNFTVTNTLLDPTIHGNLQLNQGVLRSPYWGIDYKDIELDISASDDKFTLDKFQIFSSAGHINASGEIQFDYKMEKDKIKYSNLSIVADRFYLVKHKDFEIQISTDIKYQMVERNPKLSGYIDVNKSSFYLPTIMDRAGYITVDSEGKKPALLIARDRKLGIDDSQKDIAMLRSRADTLNTPGFLELLEGDIELRFTRNTWVRNPQLRLELGGKLNMIMKKGNFFLKGPVDIVRGQYDLFGRRFTVIQGKIEFLGLEKINPPINLEAEYIYRTVGREKRSLVLKISGNIDYPIITFFESNNQISQDDAIAIIIYGRKTDELSFGTQSAVADESGANTAAMGLASNMLSNQLSRSVGDDLKLDVIEVNATDNWQSANFVVGKYITEDIFVTYKREFGQNMDNNLYPETISMEYEIQKYLFLQLIQGSPQVSGYDFLFRYDWD